MKEVLSIMNNLRKSSAYDEKAAESYDSKRFTTASGKLFDHLEKEKLDEALRHVPLESQVLELGAGTGRFSFYLSKRGYQAHLIDLSSPMLRICKSKFNIQKVEFLGLQCSSTHLPFRSQSFDFVFAIRLLNQLPSSGAALRTIQEMIRVCRIGGNILFEFVNGEGLTRLDYQKTTFLSMKVVHHLIDSINHVFIVNTKGILFFSQSALDKIPRIFKKIHLKVDKFFCSIAPLHATRCYVLLKKN